MSENVSETIQKKSKLKITTADIVVVALSAAVLAVCSWIYIPMTVEITLQTFAVFTIAGIFGAKRATLAVLVYILLGAIGVPVLAGMQGGIDKIIGATGGYILGFIFIALFVGFASDRFERRTMPLLIAMLLGLVVCYAFGTAWYMFVYAQSTGPVGLGTVMGWCVIPFIIPDCVKIACALMVSKRVGKYVKF